MSHRQARWAQFLTRFDFIILYHPRMQQGKADALSRNSYMELQPGEATFENQKQILLGPDRLRLMAFHAIDTPEDSSLLDSIRENLGTDEFAQEPYYPRSCLLFTISKSSSRLQPVQLA